ncbi:glutathione S-transferase family protein [Solimicrobium silvestre]|uniref:glutathione transferase n=1 Tax=Solimicrobium silvestre TaxID=2099400 RepID=A0A2S9H4W8_9BURK|nr:glutathione S-transferase [Solimicrobium silvestre]PRC95030.1 Glutathione S-transferase [Solimicrobium silvestre]
MITVHHLNNSRSQRILWLLEELGLEYQIIHYQRDPITRLAPPELKAVHPLGKSPVISDGDLVVAESAAIIEYLVQSYGNGKLTPKPATPAYFRYLEWLHFAEGSAMLPFLLALYTSRLGDAAAALQPRISGEINNHLSHMNSALEGQAYLMGDEFTAADIQNSFVAEIAQARGLLEHYPHLASYTQRFQERPAYQRALKQGGEYKLGA